VGDDAPVAVGDPQVQVDGRPCSPARAASIWALMARIFVVDATRSMRESFSAATTPTSVAMRTMRSGMVPEHSANGLAT